MSSSYPNRVGSCYLIDHGGGNSSMKLVVGPAEANVWIVASVRDQESCTMRYDEDTLSYWDELAKSERGNIRRIASASSGFEEGAVYESQDVRGDVVLVTLVEPYDADSDHVAFVWLASDAPSCLPYLGVQHHFYPDKPCLKRYRRVL